MRARELLELVGLEGEDDQLAKNLPYGDQRRLEIARALASDPVLLLLDEPTAGMNPRETQQLTDLIERLRRDLGLTILLIEHDMRVVMGISDRVTVLDHGEKIAEGTPDEVRARPEGDRGLPRGAGRMTAANATPPRATGPVDGTMLVLDDVNTYYGNIHALQGISLAVGQGEIVTLIGANGAGKTTTLKTISGLLHPRRGHVVFEGKDISRTAAHQLVVRRHRSRPGGTPDLPADDRPREPPDGRLHPRPEDDRARPRPGDGPLPAAPRADPPARRDAVGRRAADAGDRPGAHVRAASPAPRRAVARASRRSSSSRSSRRSARSTSRERPSCSSSRTRSRP